MIILRISRIVTFDTGKILVLPTQPISGPDANKPLVRKVPYRIFLKRIKVFLPYRPPMPLKAKSQKAETLSTRPSLM